MVGADDAKNSIGKSSVLMLIDYAFGGTDFPKKCDDVTRNVEHFDIGVEFEFQKKIFSFIRKTNETNYVYSINDQELIDLKKYNAFLKEKYLESSAEISFRACVSGFFRIYQRNNYNDQRPFDISARESWNEIKVRLLKLFGKHEGVEILIREGKLLKKASDNLAGTFNSGIVKKISKTQFEKNQRELFQLKSESNDIKSSLKDRVTDINSVINRQSRDLKEQKDSLLSKLDSLEIQKIRIQGNLNGQKVRSAKAFKEVLDYFPEINESRLAEVESFHVGITKILKNKLLEEKKLLDEGIQLIQADIGEIDEKLSAIVDSQDGANLLLEKLIELDRETQKINSENELFELNQKTKDDIKENKECVTNSFQEALNTIAEDLNSLMKLYINKLYSDSPIAPEVSFGTTDYKFIHGDDRGTGKGFGNLISLDLAVLESTQLPCLIHDSVLFKNLDIPAVENLIETYTAFNKQVFIAIDEVPKYSSKTQQIIIKSQFIKLSREKLAFRKSWKRST